MRIASVKKGNGNSVNSIVLSHYEGGVVRGNNLVSDLSVSEVIKYLNQESVVVKVLVLHIGIISNHFFHI